MTARRRRASSEGSPTGTVTAASAIGSGVAQLLRVSRDQAGTLLGCGAAAGIASVFNAPIAGVFFVLEIMLRDFSVRTFTPIVVASVFSTAVTQAVLGKNTAIFAVSDELAGYAFTLPELPSYLVLGLVCGAVAVGFVKLLYASEDAAAAAVESGDGLRGEEGGVVGLPCMRHGCVQVRDALQQPCLHPTIKRWCGPHVAQWPGCAQWPG